MVLTNHGLVKLLVVHALSLTSVAWAQFTEVEEEELVAMIPTREDEEELMEEEEEAADDATP